MPISMTINGNAVEIETPPAWTLLDVLRESLDLTGTKYGCGDGSCRSCTVLIDGRPRAACQTEAAGLDGANIRTIEGLADGDRLHPLQEAFIAENAVQCGYCVPGMIMTAAALLETNPAPDRGEIVDWMNGNLCRCCNYVNIVNAIERAAATMAEGNANDHDA